MPPSVDYFKFAVDIFSILGNTFTIVASGIAIYLFLTKRSEITAAFRLLLSYSYQTTLSELKEKLERLNEYRATDPKDISEIKNILHEIAGQIRGNAKLHAAAPDLARRCEALASGKKLTEPNKRSLVSEIREVLKNLNVTNIEDFTGNKS